MSQGDRGTDDTCRIIIFPLWARAGKVRHVTEVLLRQQGRSREHYWQATINSLRTKLLALGCSEAEVHVHRTVFRDAVQAEIDRLSAAPSNDNPAKPDGAA